MVVFRPHLHRFGLVFSRLLLAVYVGAAAFSPLLHHDVICHFQSPTHCTTCLIGSAAEGPSEAQAASDNPLVVVGSIFAGQDAKRDAALPGDRYGRSPPPQG
jgi:hypothetical protein